MSQKNQTKSKPNKTSPGKLTPEWLHRLEWLPTCVWSPVGSRLGEKVNIFSFFSPTSALSFIPYKVFCTLGSSVTIGVSSAKWLKTTLTLNYTLSHSQTKFNWEVRTEIIPAKPRLNQHLCWFKFWAVPAAQKEPHDCQYLWSSQGTLKCWQERSSQCLTGRVWHFRGSASKAHLPMLFFCIKNCESSFCNLCFYQAASPQRTLKYFASQRPFLDLSYIGINENYPDGRSESALCVNSILETQPSLGQKSIRLLV